MTTVVRGKESGVRKNKGGDFVRERGGRLGWYERYRGPSRSKDALRMTAKNKQRRRTDNGKGNDKGQYGDSGCARMTTGGWNDEACGLRQNYTAWVLHSHRIGSKGKCGGLRERWEQVELGERMKGAA